MSTIAPVVKQISVNAPADHCFRIFTDGIDRWWPRQHHIGKTPLKQAVIEPREGGRWYATHEDGSQTDTGRVLVWDPPRRLVLSWQIRADWQYDPDFVTEIEVTFTPDGPDRTIVILEHRDLERFGPTALEHRNNMDSPAGWGVIMTGFKAAAEESVRT